MIAEKNKFLGKLLPCLPEWTVLLFLRKNTENRIFPASGNSELVKAYMFEQSYGMMSKAQFLARYNCVIDFFKAPQLTQTKPPVLIVEADNDPLVAKELRDLLKTTYPAAPVKSLGKVGHFPYLNTPEQYVRIVRDFFDLN
jgi:pimeloyl-ACP methyl ester carboxylesterase